MLAWRSQLALHSRWQGERENRLELAKETVSIPGEFLFPDAGVDIGSLIVRAVAEVEDR